MANRWFIYEKQKEDIWIMGQTWWGRVWHPRLLWGQCLSHGSPITRSGKWVCLLHLPQLQPDIRRLSVGRPWRKSGSCHCHNFLLFIWLFRNWRCLWTAKRHAMMYLSSLFLCQLYFLEWRDLVITKNFTHLEESPIAQQTPGRRIIDLPRQICSYYKPWDRKSWINDQTWSCPIGSVG